MTIRQVDPRDRGAMARELAAAQVMAALSDYEAHPVGVMEALTLGVPVVGFDVAGHRRPRRGRAGAAACRRTPAAPAIAAALAAALDSDAPRGRPDLDLPTWEPCAEQLGEVYRATVRGTRPVAAAAP